MSKRKRRTPPRLGRPPLPPKEALSAVLPIRCRGGEKRAFEAAAKRQGLSLSAWIRDTLKRAVGLTDG